LVDVILQPHRLHTLDVAGARAKAKPVEDVDNALFPSQIMRGQILRFCTLLSENNGLRGCQREEQRDGHGFLQVLEIHVRLDAGGGLMV